MADIISVANIASNLLFFCVILLIFVLLRFYARQRTLAMAILSVHPSVRPSRPGTESSPGEIETPGFHHMVTKRL